MYGIHRIVDPDMSPSRGVGVCFPALWKRSDTWGEGQNLALEYRRAFWRDRIATCPKRPKEFECLRRNHLSLKRFDICSHAILIKHRSNMRNARQYLKAQEHVEVIAPKNHIPVRRQSFQ